MSTGDPVYLGAADVVLTLAAGTWTAVLQSQVGALNAQAVVASGAAATLSTVIATALAAVATAQGPVPQQ